MVTFEQMKAVARRAAPIVLLGMLGLGAIALIYSLVAPKTYQSTARVIVEPRSRTITDQDVVGSLPQRDEAVVDTEVQFLDSRAVAARVVRDERLVNDPEFGGGSVDAAVARFDDALSIRRVGMTYLIDISVDSRSPQRAAALANATAEAYVELQKERKRAATQAATDLLRRRVDAMAGELRQAEGDVQRFRIANNLMSINGTTLAEQSAAQLSDQLAMARAQERAALGRLAAASGAPVATETANTQYSLGSLRTQQATAMQDMSAAQSRYGPRHPNYLAAQQRLNEINAAIDAETQRARAAVGAERQQQLSDLRAQAAAASNNRRSLEGSAGANSAGLARNSRASTALAELERRAQALRATYETYLNRYQQTVTQLGTEQSDSNLVSAAAVPLRPYKPNTKFNVGVALLGGLLAGLSIATIMMLFESHFSTGVQIEEELDLEALPPLASAQSTGLFPRGARPSSAEIAAAMLAHPTDAFAEMHKNLLSAISRPLATGANQVVAITSALPREGKTTSAICLAAMAAHTGRKVLLLDCDQRRRGVTKELVGEPQHGLSDVLAGRVPLANAIVTSTLAGMHVLPTTSLAASDVDIFDSQAFRTMLDAARKQYDLILVDTAPVLPIADTRIIVANVDSVLFTCRWRHTPRRAVENALEILGRTGAPIAGVALTQLDLTKQSKFGYGDSVFYYNKYKDYYATAS